MNKIKRIQDLVSELNVHRHNYYNLNSPTITDQEYDNMFDELSKLEKEANYTPSNSPTVTVGAYEVISKLQKRTHPISLKSLDKTKSLDELNKWKKSKDIILMLKADGLTIEVDYRDGKLIGAYTRGSGEIGEDVTHNARVFKNLPLTIPFKGELRVVGEAIIHKNDFETINSKLPEEDKYATPRNLCSGSVRQLNSKICSQREVYFYAFNILKCDEELSDSKYERFKWLNKLGFWTIPNMKISDDINNEYIDTMKEAAIELNLPIDGLVASFDSVSYSNTLGETSHHPLHSMAFKFDDELAETVLQDVEWRTTRTGQINPTAKFNTVILDGTEVSRASLHNLSFIEQLNLNTGCRILVSKRNLIIPHVEDNLDRDNGELEYPKKCPSCGGKTRIKDTGTADILICENELCPAQLLDRFVNFVKRDGMNIEGLSEATLRKFINLGFIQTFDDIYNLDQYKNEIIKLEGFGIKSYNRLIESINNSRKVKMQNLLVGLGISNIGKTSSKIIAEYFNHDWFAFEDALCNGFDFSTLKDFGEIANQSLHDWYNNSQQRKMWNKLTYILDFVKEEKQEVRFKSLEGLNFVVTGKVKTFKNRKELESLIASLSGRLSSSVSSKTNYLINNDVDSNSGKNKKAKQLGVEIISETQFNEMIGR